MYKNTISSRGWLTLQLMILLLGFRLSYFIGIELAILVRRIDVIFTVYALWLVTFVNIKTYIEAKYRIG